MGRVPLWPGCRDERYPGVSSWESLEHIGPMTRSVRDSALMMSVMAGPDMRDRHSIPCSDVDWLASLDRPLQGCASLSAPTLAISPSMRKYAPWSPRPRVVSLQRWAQSWRRWIPASLTKAPALLRWWRSKAI